MTTLIEPRVRIDGAHDQIEATPYTLREILEFPETGPPAKE